MSAERCAECGGNLAAPRRPRRGAPWVCHDAFGSSEEALAATRVEPPGRPSRRARPYSGGPR